MRKQNVVLSSLIGMYLISGVTFSSFANDVYVDLSVLGALRHSEEFVVDNAPLFPDVKNAPKTVKKKKAVKSSKAVTKKNIKPKTKPVIKDSVVEKQLSAPVVEAKTEILPTPVVNELDFSSESAQVDSLPIVENAFNEAKKQVEEIAKPVAKEKSVEQEINTPQPIVPQDILPTEDIVASQTEPVQAPELLVEQPKLEPIVDNTDETNEQDIVEPIVSAPQEVPNTVLKNNQIYFADGSDELSDEHKHKLDAIITGFSSPNTNMIAINSYNYDDGTDVFNKKRLSLRRIVAVRSYLLNLGYKNFMPKVINLTDDISKSNIVELEEIK